MVTRGFAISPKSSSTVDPIFKEISEVFPEVTPIDRTSTHAWSHPEVRAAVDATRRKKLIMAGIWTEVCLAQTVLGAGCRPAGHSRLHLLAVPSRLL
jgi:nicotinamidase-related amidase